MRKFTVLFSLLFCFGLMAQNANYEDPLPENTRVTKGVLPNGLTYYIYPSQVVKDAASYYIIQNVGSILENDDQQGLAHFLEHMAFNGTDNFPDKGILNTLQKHGAVFGKDINAYTSFDETVYNMNNIPTTPELVDTCLLVLHDWANFLSLEDEEIDAERGVIKEEWRTRQSGRMRIFQKNMPTVFNNSIYAERMPIGLMDVVDNFEYKALRDFYHDWYRTDLQAIAIIGDVDAEAVEAKIKTLFSAIPAIDNPRERFIVRIPENDQLMFSSASDEEVTTASLSFGIRHPKSLSNETVSDLKESLLNSMVTKMISERLGELSDKPDATFFRAFVGYGDNSRATNAFTVSISPKPDQQHAAFETVMKEVNRAVKFGFNEAEIERMITRYKNSYENQISKLDDRSHASIQSMIQNNYLENETMTDIVKEYAIAQQIFDDLTPEEVHANLKRLYTDKNRYMTATAVSTEKNITENEALQIIASAENDISLTAYEDGFSGKTLLGETKIKQGKVTSEKLNKATGSTTFTLSNGVKVHYKFADKNKNDVRLSALSYGGLSLVDDAKLPSANYVNSLVRSSGLGDYSSTDLSKVLAGKTANTGIFISNLSEGISGSSSTKDVETMLQMAHLRFVKPRFDEDAFKVLIGNLDNYLISRSNNINEKIKDSINVALYGKNDPKQPLFTKDYINSISFETIQQIYGERFKNVSDFEFFIVGDVSKEQLKPLLEKYIASIPTKKQTETYKDNSSQWLSKTIEKDVHLKMEDPKSTVRITYKNDLEYTIKNMLIARALGDILKLRYTETLREQEGGTYGASAFAGISKRPVEKATIFVGFDCNPEKVDRLVSIVHEELQKIAAGDINQTDLDKTTTNYLKERAQEKGFNQYDMSVLVNFYREDYDMNDPDNFENIVESISVNDIKEFTSNVLNGADIAEIIVKPSNKII
ncbi:M16 family metallopeptidase [Gelidibacter maritimus]|uniref:Insulinase family protein n=1 Tax=Gelidibacter maritimus TaxID=2761487 RepID=A0A7W2R4M4_9FLAO|nr:M16 family metallopeptidase [Gelidibacter maritimus]MBA6154017.1 insulinase family protein [Gelidibacter maritimus]